MHDLIAPGDGGWTSPGERYPLRRLSHRDQAPPLASRGNLDAIGDKREHRPSAMEQHSRNNNKATWDRTNGGTFPKVGKGGQRRRVDRELAVVRNCLDHKDPDVCAAEPPTDRAGEADVVARIAIVPRQQLGPAQTQPNAFAPDHRRVEISLE